MSVRVFQFGTADFLFSTKDYSKNQIKISSTSKDRNESLLNIKLTYRGPIEIIEVVEFERLGNKFLRVNAIRETSELQSHEFDMAGVS